MQSFHRPTREELLAAATSAWERFRIRFKHWSIRSMRPFNVDDISAFFSFFVVGNTLLLILGTTTFVSLILFTANSLQFQEFIARRIGNYLTRETGITIVFENAIVPNWKSSKIAFENVFVSRRPKQTTPSEIPREMSSGSTEIAPPATPKAVAQSDNYTYFDMTIDKIEVTLSVWRWLDGKGLVKDADIKGVRGIVDRRHVRWDHTKVYNPADWRRTHNPGDFELEMLTLEDLLLTVYQPHGFRPYNVSIFNADMTQFRKQWLLYDVLTAESITGSFDDCLFSVHKAQNIGKTNGNEKWKRISRLRIDGVNIDHFNTGASGIFSWITKGRVDVVANVKFPRDPDEDVDLKSILHDIVDNIDAVVVNPEANRRRQQKMKYQGDLLVPDDEEEVIEPTAWEIEKAQRGRPRVEMDFDIRFKDVKAAVPFVNPDLSYVSSTLIRPIVGYVNANRVLIPIHCGIIMDLKSFDGSWTIFDSGLMYALQDGVYEALANHVQDETERKKRMRRVGAWTALIAARALLTLNG